MQRGKAILRDGLIKCNIDRVYNEKRYGTKNLSTTDGYSYLSNFVSKAMYYGNSAQVVFDPPHNGRGYFYIFEAKIEANELLPDLDNIRIYSQGLSIAVQETVEFSIEFTSGVCINRDLKVPGDVLRYAIMPTSNNYQDVLNDITQGAVGNNRNNELSFESLKKIPWIPL